MKLSTRTRLGHEVVLASTKLGNFPTNVQIESRAASDFYFRREENLATRSRKVDFCAAAQAFFKAIRKLCLNLSFWPLRC